MTPSAQRHDVEQILKRAPARRVVPVSGQSDLDEDLAAPAHLPRPELDAVLTIQLEPSLALCGYGP